MFKTIQFKIILTFFVVISIISIGLAGYSIYKFQDIVPAEEMTVYKTTIAIVCTIVIFLCTLIAIIIARKIVRPIFKLTKNAKKVAQGDIPIVGNESKETNTELSNLEDAFGIMTNELSKNFREVQKQKSQMETILLHMTDGIIAFDLRGKIIHSNPAAHRMLKLNSEDNTFEKISKKLELDADMEKIIYMQKWTSAENNINIGESYLKLYIAPFKDENEISGGIVIVIQDITEHVKLDNMRKEFVANVSHELKTPLTSIMGYSDTLLESEYDKETENRFIGVISTEAHRMSRLVSDLLQLSRMDNKRKRWTITRFDLGELVKKSLEKLQIEMDKKEITTECFVTSNVPPVIADKDGIEQVILNILSNSIKYTKEGGSIKVYVGFVYNDAYIKVIDNGVGIPKKDLGMVFERFYRVDKARSREMGGTGLRTFNCKRNTR